MPACSSPSPSVLAVRPAATSRWLPAMVRSPSPSRMTTLSFAPSRSTRTIATWLRMSTPSRASASSTTSAHSGSSLRERLRRFQHGDRGAETAKRLRKLETDRPAADDDEVLRQAWRDRIPSRWSGTAPRRSPGIGGSDGDEPVAITKRRALISMPSPATTVARSLKRAAASITRTPRPVKRSLESFGAMAAITSCTCRRTLAKSTVAGPADTPNASASAMPCARLAAAISAFEGTQPVLRHSPPSLPFSISTTGTPNAAAAAATDSPPAPAPMTQMSGVRISAMSWSRRCHAREDACVARSDDMTCSRRMESHARARAAVSPPRAPARARRAPRARR